jgi:hypothetical protein
MLDRYAFYGDSSLAINSPLSDYYNATSSDEVPNGAWWNVQFCKADGSDLPASAAATGATTYTWNSPVGGVGSVAFGLATNAQGVPIQVAVNAAGGAAVPDFYQLYIRFYSSEKLVLSPFIFADSCEWETGLFGINNIQLVMNMKSDPSRVLRLDPAPASVGGAATRSFASNPAYLNIQGTPFTNAQINVQFLTPSLDLPLPQKSVVPYTEFPRYISTGESAWGANETSRTLQSQTIVLPQIPDMLLIYCKPDTGVAALSTAPTVGDYYFPLTQISLNFDNFSGLLSSMTADQLYQMSAHNGLEMDFNEWIGAARIGSGIYAGGLVQTVGGFLVIRPGQDFGLQSGQAPSLIGNYTLQFQVRAENRFARTGVKPVLYVIAVNSGFFETLAGSSRVIKGVLSEADIISAEPIMEMSRDGLKRIVGNGFFSNLGSFLTKAVDIYTKTKPIVSGVKGMLPEGKIKDILGKVGYGMPAGAGMAGAGPSAGAGKKSLSARLM